jgi:hypothetical protein
MQPREIIQRLRAIEADLATAIDSLTHSSLSDSAWPEALVKAAANLESIRFDESLNAERGLIEQLLRHLAEQTKVTKTLLDTAAALYFGRLLSGRFVECGYLADGAVAHAHYGGMRIEG